MNTHKLRLNGKDVFSQVISISIATAITLVFLGPIVDHHYVERQHNHSHIYLHTSLNGDWHPESHPFETPHSHSHFSAHSGQHHTIIYQSSNDGIGDSKTFFVKALISDSSTLIHRYNYYDGRQATGESKLNEIIVIPPERPPRT